MLFNLNILVTARIPSLSTKDKEGLTCCSTRPAASSMSELASSESLDRASGSTPKMVHSYGWLIEGLHSLLHGPLPRLAECLCDMVTRFPQREDKGEVTIACQT